MAIDRKKLKQLEEKQAEVEALDKSLLEQRRRIQAAEVRFQLTQARLGALINEAEIMRDVLRNEI